MPNKTLEQLDLFQLGLQPSIHLVCRISFQQLEVTYPVNVGKLRRPKGKKEKRGVAEEVSVHDHGLMSRVDGSGEDGQPKRMGCCQTYQMCFKID